MTLETSAALKGSTVARALTLFYGVGTYLFFFATFLYLIGFVGNWLAPRSIDHGIVSASTGRAVVIDLLLLAVFALQHSIMARPSFKLVWTRWVPRHLERTTYVLLSTAILALLAWQWRPLPELVWQISNPLAAGILTAIAWVGWAIVLLSTFLIDHFDLFGLRQTVAYALGIPFAPPTFKEHLFYRWVRHPLMLGFIIAFWATPVMSQGHLLFAIMTTLYILIAIQIEERTLMHLHGQQYLDYRRRVSMIVPFLGRQS